MPLVSIIMPTYNRRELLSEAIGSVLNQTYENFQLVIVDDGSTDGTKDMIKEYRDPRIKYIFQKNRGVSGARNRGVFESSGEYVSFLDSDDLWKRDKLKIQTDLMNNKNDIFISYTDEIWMRKGIRVNPMNKHKKYSGWIFEKCLSLCIVSPSSVMMRRELFNDIGLFDESLPVCEDYDMWLRISSQYPVFLIDKKLIIKRGGHPGQLSKRSWGNDIYRVKALLKILKDDHLSQNYRKKAREELIKKCRILANGYFKRGKIKKGNQYINLIEKHNQS
ncbi:MAG TPA: glycosyltransferase [Nitrospinota bacterium]|nr:glycosyltransferase [Nitrospinota bacterium]